MNDGPETLTFEEYLEEALESAENENTKYWIRTALQQHKVNNVP